MKSVEIKNYPSYLIYEDGRVYSKKTKRFLKQCLNRGGYFIVNLSKKGEKPKSHRVHRLVAENLLPPAPEDRKDVNHIDGDKTNNHVSNLEWSNKVLNGVHAHKLGLNKSPELRGEDHGCCVLTEADILNIRALKLQKVSNAEIAKIYNISKTHVWRIVTKQSWSHI